MAKLKWAIQSPEHKKTLIDSQSIYAWLAMVMGFILLGLYRMKVDVEGNVYSTGPGGLWIFSPTGELIRQVKTPRITNLAWGGKERKTLFMTAPDAVYKLEMTKKGYSLAF